MQLLTRRRLLSLTLPVVLANAATPLLGLVDTAVIGHTGDVAALGAIALASLVFNFIFWAFGFLRMSTAGFVAQAAGTIATARTGAADLALGDHCLRALVLALGLGVVLIALQWPLLTAARFVFAASADVENLLADYFVLRIYGAPAALINYALIGILIGLGQYRALLALQIFLNGINLLLDVLLVIGFDMGVRGIALGTLIAEWCTAIAGLLYVYRRLTRSYPALQLNGARLRLCLRDPKALSAMLNTNLDIFWRSLLLLASFALFTNLNAEISDPQLASVHLLLQLIALAAFLLDGFAHIAETHAGHALGARDSQAFNRALRLTLEIAGISGVALALICLVAGPKILALLTPLAEVQTLAVSQLPFAALYIALAWPAFVLDGIFIGTLATRAMRNALMIACALFIPAALLLAPFGYVGLWSAFCGFVVMRALTLTGYLPALKRRLAAPISV